MVKYTGKKTCVLAENTGLFLFNHMGDLDIMLCKNYLKMYKIPEMGNSIRNDGWKPSKKLVKMMIVWEA